jgi:hypothetical protein
MGSNSFQSAPVSGLIDRLEPFVVSRSPRNGAPYVFDDEIALIFNEPINCKLPSTFIAELRLPNSVLNVSVLSVSCQSNTRLSIFILASAGLNVCLVVCRIECLSGIIFMQTKATWCYPS